jgi:1,4-alpha-glucan branching enzyme
VADGDHHQFVLDDGRAIADTASRQQASTVEDASVVTDQMSYQWQNADWTGRPWHEAVTYERPRQYVASGQVRSGQAVFLSTELTKFPPLSFD